MFCLKKASMVFYFTLNKNRNSYSRLTEPSVIWPYQLSGSTDHPLIRPSSTSLDSAVAQKLESICTAFCLWLECSSSIHSYNFLSYLTKAFVYWACPQIALSPSLTLAIAVATNSAQLYPDSTVYLTFALVLVFHFMRCQQNTSQLRWCTADLQV